MAVDRSKSIKFARGRNAGLRKTFTSVSLKRTLSIARSNQFVDKKPTSSLVSAFKVISHASFRDKLFLFIGCFFALVNGVCWPLMNFFMAKFAQELSPVLTHQDLVKKVATLKDANCSDPANLTLDQNGLCNLSERMQEERYQLPHIDYTEKILSFTIPAICVVLLDLVTGFLNVLILNYTAERIVFHLRKRFLKSLLNQDICWFDSRTQGELVASIMRNLNLVQTALGEKLGTFLLCISEVTVSLVFCFWSGWELTLVMACLYPILIGTGKFNVKFQVQMNKIIRVVNGELAGIVQEVLSAIRTVFAFSGEKVELDRFTGRLHVARKLHIKQYLAAGINFSFVLLVTQCFIALGFWYGVKLMQETHQTVLDKGDSYNVQDVLVIIAMVLLSGVFIRQAVPLLEVLNTGFIAAADIISVIDRKPAIDSRTQNGKRLECLTGNIEFDHVHFWFPTSPGEKRILRGLSLTIKAGETVALVGPSGGGKSTILQLVQRFYDPQKGKVKVDGTNLSEFNIGWFRQNIGIVSQEPSLFNTTVKDNIMYGNPQATQDDLIRAAKDANAHEFILKLPLQYDTVVGEQGSLLSGGQRQRIAIARALIRNPAILLLDEATSALDNESEAMVQESLDAARHGRTTIIIAHRLSTIRTADRIVGIKGGRVVEQGTHEELMDKEGLYYQLLLTQMGQQQTVETAEEEEEEDEEEQHDDDDMDDDDLDDYLYSLTSHTNEQEQQTQKEMRKSFWKILIFCRHDWRTVCAGLFFSAVYALSHPSRAIIFGYLSNMVVLRTLQRYESQITLWPCMYVLVGFLSFAAVAIKTSAQSLAEENLLFRIRRRILEAIFKQEIGWFDEPKQSVSNLCAMVTIDAENVKKIPGAVLGTWLYAVVAIVVMFGISIYVQWKLSLAVSVLSISVFAGHFLKGKVEHGMLLSLISTEDEANNVAIEAIRNFRTVVSLHIQDIVCNLYNEALGQPRQLTNRFALLRAMVVGLSNPLLLSGITVALSYGGLLMYKDDLSYGQFNMINSMLIINLMEVSQVLAAMPSYNKACISANKIFRLLARKPAIDSSSSAGIELTDKTGAKIEFRDVCFSYPSRPTEQILKNINLVVESGQTVAFVGGSGCGKSTSMQLMQRLYDPMSGGVALNGYNIRCVNIPSLRSLIGLVSQEPVLFHRTIAENIAYGNNSRQVCMHEIIEAAQKANIHEFIVSLRQGYETRVGARGVQLSGGQKQRVAIARALIRNPRILLLDEATSALDNESEKIVQESLDKAREGRTCIIIAHRLSTIQNVDKILVFAQGQIVEQGTPDELFQKRGVYYEILQIQQGQRRRLSRIIL